MLQEGAERQELERKIDAVALLKDPARRSLYLFVCSSAREVGRDEAAKAFGMARPTAAYHLDKLAEHKLLTVSFRWRSGEQSRGRTSKFYRQAREQLTVTLPPS